MANRYWVGGTGNWSSTTKWSDTSGGSPGASVPTSSDDAIIDANSGNGFTAFVDTAQSVNSLTITPRSGAVTTIISFNANLTTGNLTTTGTAGNNRILFTIVNTGILKNFTVNGTVNISDCDFRGLYVSGTAAPISGTRIGNRGECLGITFSAPKTVYWNLAGAALWSANGWCAASGGTPNTDNFPLPQDTAVINNDSLGTSITIGSQALSSIDCSARTTAFQLNINATNTAYGNWTNGPGITLTGANIIIFSGGTTQTITSAGKTFPSGITVDTYGGTVQLADALNIGTSTLTITNGTFDTKGYAVNAGTLSSSNGNVRTINLGASTITLSASTDQLVFTIKTNLTFNAGTSSIVMSVNVSGSTTLATNGLIFNNFTYTNAVTSTFGITLTGANTFNNLTFFSPNGSLLTVFFDSDQTISGTLTCAGASVVRRIFLRSNTPVTRRNLQVNSISATDCDFRDIALTGAASGASPTRAGDCGGNTGITFPTPKTVYWNLAGSQNWNATGWALSSGGTPAIENFPLAQDTAVFDDTGSAGTIAIVTCNIGTFDASLRTSAMTLNTGFNNPTVYGNWTFGTGVTSASNTGILTFAKNGTQTITSNGVQFGCPVTINHPLANVQLGDSLAIASNRTLTLSGGTFDAVTYNVTTGFFTGSASSDVRTLKMGSGTWTLSGVGAIWIINNLTNFTVFSGTANIVLSDTSTSARSFLGGGVYYNKLTIGGATGTSITTITGNNTFGELASTKTVAHTIDFGSTTQTFGKWSVTGTAGNLVTITGTSTTNIIAGPAVTDVDYLVMGSWGISTTSPGEFYAGANSTGTAAAPVFRTAAPTPRTLYWVGGTGNWSSTTKWSTSSGGGSGAAIPTSLDAVIFNSGSNATAYTATIDAGITIARCASFTMAGPASGNVTFAGTVGIAFHGNVSFAATGITRTYTGAMNWAGNSSYTFTTNGVVLSSSDCTVIGIGSTWTLGSALAGFGLTVTYGTFNTSTSNYSWSGGGSFSSNNTNKRTVNLNGSTLTVSSLSSTAFNFATTTNLTFNADSSTLVGSGSTSGVSTGGLIFNNVSFTSTVATSITITGENTFANTLSFAGRTSVGVSFVRFNANQTIGTLTLNAGSSAHRTFLASDTIGTPRTLTVGTLTAGAADIDFRDINVTGVASPISGTRFGDCKGNRGITFNGGINKYWTTAGGGNWSATGWASIYSESSPFGDPYPGSIQIDGSTGFIEASEYTSATVGTITGDFTFESWFRITGTSQAMSYIFCAGDDRGGYGLAVFTTGANAGAVRVTLTPSSGLYSQTFDSTAGLVSLNTWYHIAATRSGSTVKVYLNGVQVATGTNSTTQTVTSGGGGTATLKVGRMTPIGSFTYGLIGNISNLRIVKGTALYTSNFTPSTTPLTAVSDTSLLVRGTNPLADISTNNFRLTVNGGASVNSFPLAQDTAVFQAATATLNNGSTLTIDASYNIGTIDMSARTSNTMTLATSTNSPAIYGNWINGTGTTLSGTGQITFAGRGSQTITSAGRTFSANPTINSPGGTFTLADPLTVNGTFTTLTSGTFNLAGYTATVFEFQSSNSNIRVLDFGTNGLISCSGWSASISTNFTVTGTGTISMTSASAKNFTGGSISYSGVTLNQGGAGALTILGNNTFKTITNTYSATGATSISLGATTQTLTQPWTATGAAGRVLTVSGTSAASPGTLIFTGTNPTANVDYLAINNVRAYNLNDTWYAGPNSTNGGSLGWIFSLRNILSVATGNFLQFFL